MEIYGSGMLNLGYLGGVYDAGTGLIYMGNGQYYDPSTGRFLTRGAQQDQRNPYTPWNSDPAGMLIAPLALLALVFGRKKTRTKFDQFIVLFVIVVSVGLSVSAFAWAPISFQNEGPPIPWGTQPSTYDPPVPPMTSENVSVYWGTTDNGETPEEQWEPTEKPKLKTCNGNYIELDLDRIDMISSLTMGQYFGTRTDFFGQYFGTAVDFRGVLIATYYKELIEFYANQNERVTPIMVAVGIAIQSNYSGDTTDMSQEIYAYFNPDSERASHFAYGIGQFSESQIEEMLKEALDPRDAKVAIRAMVKRIDRVLDNEKVAKYCTGTDQMILAIIAQQNNDYDVNDVVAKADYLHGGNGITNINWEQYFSDLARDRKLHVFKDNITVTNSYIRSDPVDYQTQFMLKRAVLDLELLKELGWVLGVHTVEMKRIANSE